MSLESSIGSLTSRRPLPLYRLFAFMARPAFRVLFRPQVSGIEHVPPGGFVLAANQLSNIDSFALADATYPRVLRAMAKGELFGPLLGPVIRRLDGFPVARGSGDMRAIETATHLARAGEVVLIFPEGTRRRKGFRKKLTATPHSGACHVALRAEVPLVPAAICGTEALSRLRQWRIAFGEPVPLDDLRGLPLFLGRREGTQRLWERIAQLERSLADER